MKLDLSRPYEAEIYLNIHDIELVRLLARLLRPGGVMVDVGANRGLCTLVAARTVGKAGRVHCFEPNPRTHAQLEEHLQLNDLSNVRAVRAACWSSKGVANFYDHGQDESELSSMRPGNLGLQPTAEYQVPTVRLDEEVTGLVDVIKIDAEGAEWEILRGADAILHADQPPHLILELSPTSSALFGYHPLEMLDWLLAEMPGAACHEITRKRIVPMTRAAIEARLRSSPGRWMNLWISPRQRR